MSRAGRTLDEGFWARRAEWEARVLAEHAQRYPDFASLPREVTEEGRVAVHTDCGSVAYSTVIEPWSPDDDDTDDDTD